MGGPSRFSNILEILENPTEVFAWMITISNTTPRIVSTVKPPYLLGFIFSNVPITVFVVQSEPNNYLVLIQKNHHYAFNQPEHKVQRLILQVQAGRISSQDQEAHRKLLEVDSTVLRVRVGISNVIGDIFRLK